jgi:hypothetical protein
LTDAPSEHEAPPTGEELHLPGPSIVPFLNAVGLVFALVGLTTSWVLIVLGLALFLVTTVRWIADTRRDIDALPANHSAH